MSNIKEVMKAARERAEAQTPAEAASAALRGGATHVFVEAENERVTQLQRAPVAKVQRTKKKR